MKLTPFLFRIFCIIASKNWNVKWTISFCPKESKKEKTCIIGFVCVTILKNNLERKNFRESMLCRAVISCILTVFAIFYYNNMALATKVQDKRRRIDV